jgi:G patch domain/KOW motif-containing protein
MLRKRGQIEIVADEDVKGKKRNMGLKMLQGMGWKEGRKVGKNPVTYLEKPIELKTRPKGLGLGATTKEELINKMIGKEEKKEVNEKDIVINEEVQIVNGKHKGIKGIVVNVEKEYDNLTGECFQHEETVVSLEINGVVVKTKRKDVVKISQVKGIEREERKKDKKKKKKKKKEKKKEPWVRAGLKVRIKSKKYHKGKYYLKKGLVLDKINKKCIVQLESGDILEDMKGRLNLLN